MCLKSKYISHKNSSYNFFYFFISLLIVPVVVFNTIEKSFIFDIDGNYTGCYTPLTNPVYIYQLLVVKYKKKSFTAYHVPSCCNLTFHCTGRGCCNTAPYPCTGCCSCCSCCSRFMGKPRPERGTTQQPRQKSSWLDCRECIDHLVTSMFKKRIKHITTNTLACFSKHEYLALMKF